MQAPEKTDKRKQATESLRLALSMRGGVSLAVWIGGAVAEIDTLRKASAPVLNPDRAVSRDDVYSALLELASYDGVEVDILTGASAGGLNGAIYAASLVYGFDFDQMADVWLELADIEALSRPVVWTEAEQALSLLDGDGYFLEKCRSKLEDFVKQEQTGGALTAQVKRLDLLLSATRRVPERQVLRNDSFNEINESRSSAFFHFHHLGELDSPLSDFGADASGGYSDSVNRLAHAGRASSSFPVAFEPATIKSTPDEPPSADNLFGIFSESGDSVEVLDGGVLDNIPVAKAIEAIAAAPAEAPTSRWLLYLHPSPAVREESEVEDGKREDGDKPAQSRLVGIIADLKATLLLKFNNESLVDDMIELDRHNARVAERRATRITLLQTARRRKLSADSAFAAWAAADAQHVREILADPTLSTATHPFVKRVYDDLADDWTPVKRSALFTLLQETLTEHYASINHSGGGVAPVGNRLPLIALSDTVEVLLTIAQQVLVENRDAQRMLYRIRLLVEVLNSIWEQSWLEAVQRAPEDGSAEVVEWIAATSVDCMRRSEILSEELLQALNTAPNGQADPLHAALRTLYDDRVAVAFDPDSNMPSLEPVWALVEKQAQAIIDEAERSQGFEDPVVEALQRALAKPDLGLSWFSQTCAPLHRRRVSGESEIKFLQVAGSNKSPLARFFGDGDGPLLVTDKLAGNQIANFGAFFSAQFRANDWMWGRLDAAQSLVDLLADSMRWFNDEDTPVEAVLAALEDVVVSTPFGEAGHGWDTWVRAEWETHKQAVEEELRAAKPSAALGVSHPLDSAKKLLVSRLQAEILCTHIHWVSTTGETVGRGGDVEKPGTVDACLALAGALTAGTDRIPQSLDSRRWARIGMRLGLNAWNALTPGGARQWIFALFKPLYLSVLGLLVLPRRALLSAAIGIGALAVGRWAPGGDLFSRDLDDWFERQPVLEFLTWPRILAAVIAISAGLVAVFMQIKGGLRKNMPRRSFVAAGGALAVVLIGAGLVSLASELVLGLVILGGALAAAAVVATLYRGSAKAGATQGASAMSWSVVLLGGLVAGGILAMMVTGASLLPGIVPIAAVFVVLVGMNWMYWPHQLAIAIVAVLCYQLWWRVLQQGWWAVLSFTTAVFLSTLYVSKVDVFVRPAGGDGLAS